MAELLGASISTERFQTALFLSFSLLAVMIAAAGLYGVIAFNVARRTREIGVRMALGARGSDLIRSVMLEGLALAAVGVALAVPATLLSSRLLESLVFGVSPRDPITIAAAGGGLLVVAAIASLRPAIRAARVDPATSLRNAG